MATVKWENQKPSYGKIATGHCLHGTDLDQVEESVQVQTNTMEVAMVITTTKILIL